MFLNTEMTSERIALWLRTHLKKILAIFFLSVLTGFAFIGWKEWKEREEKKIQNSLYELQKALKQLVDKAEGKQDEKQPDFLPDLDQQKNLVLTEEMKEKASLYEEGLKQNLKSRVSAVSAIDLADFYYRYGETEKAKELLHLFALPEESSSIYHLASFQLAAYYMNEEKCEEALTLLEGLSSNKKASYLHLEISLQQALCLEHLGRYEQALHKYEDILNKDPEGYTGRLAEDYKKTLVLNRNSLERKAEK